MSKVYSIYCNAIENRNGSVCTTTDRVRFPAGARDFLYSTVSRPALWLSQPTMRQGRKADHSPLSSAEVRNGGAMPSLLHMSSWHSA
jgi:hypothetical protein